ncbi:MAG: carboxypeptidase regulatory-like domain-containing protein [Nanoarchaeota archaeon]|nr:carboxypeptidase regulatory-like domain-containing protein [Nanoarchaeota archaeon]MBU1632556.1 carboxypeptidase regulatory-like domain-containing protein [Nanoarchaeota archaeon]MBU1876575.1 carboxypeptidase regulatory-like domain-containing protein [Nanoarchaeota archaeon]
MVLRKRGVFFVVLALFLVALFSNFSLSETSGCYVYLEASEDIYCVADVLDSEAKKDCDSYFGCNMNEHFIPNSDCSKIADCEEVRCNYDCDFHAKGKCTQLGGEGITDEEYPAWCPNTGCCKISNVFCQYGLNKWQCTDKAKKLGYKAYDIFDNVNMNLNTCNQQYCGVEVGKSNLKGYVKDSKGFLKNAEVVLIGTDKSTKTNDQGKFEFLSLNPGGPYVVKVTLAGYLSASSTISLLSNKDLEKNFTLTESAGVASVYGVVKDDKNNLVKGATVSWQGPKGISGQVYTNNTGGYDVSNLPSGDYTFTASKVGFQAKANSISLSTSKSLLNFEITETAFQGIQGKVYVDYNQNDKIDPNELSFGVKIYADSVFKGYSKYPDGNYGLSISISQAEGEKKFSISASHQDYNFGPEEVTIKLGESLQKDLLLTRYIGECTPPNPPKDVEIFAANHVKGKKQVKLEWTKPCPEVLNYLIKKYKDNIFVKDLPASPAEKFKIDTDVEWGSTYKYEIIAFYGEQASENAASAEITLGDEECESRYDENIGWDLFCSVDSRKTIWTCNDENKKVISQDCSDDNPGEINFCAEVGEHNAICKNAGVCGVDAQKADPFGLYYVRNTCYGTSNVESEGTANYCYFDYTDSIVNKCDRCDNVKSCFDYKGKDACAVNNCLGAECKWIDGAEHNQVLNYGLLFPGLNIPEFVTAETGTGYCVEDKYEKDDRCSSCGPESVLFENNYCTAEVCSGLGRCFSNSVTKNKLLRYCAECGEKATTDTNCYTYTFESECTGNQNIEKNDREEITLSKDRCSWNRCKWNGVSGGAGKCIKDGDANNEDDCSLFANAGEMSSCRKDNNAPTTTLLSEGLNIISTSQPNITFKAIDKDNPLGVIGYCLTSADPKNPGICKDFTEENYPGKLKDETITVDLIGSSYLQKEISGETYMLNYYSKDKYFNQEDLRTTFVYVDNLPPQFEINQEIKTVGDTTGLTVYLEGTNEPMGCTFSLQQLWPAGEVQKKVVEKSIEKKEVSFNNLLGVKFDLNVTCEDNHGNKNTKEKLYTFDLEERIDIVNPQLYGAVASTNVVFKIETIAGASCGLYLAANNEKVADFVSDEEGKVHQTASIPNFIEKEYAGEYKAVCKELFTEETYEDFFHFTIDFSAPTTKIILQEGLREETPSGYWTEYFVDSVHVSFECNSEGFECDKTFYCVGESCEAINNPSYKEYTKTFTLNESSKICYYSTDKAKNRVFSPFCGDIKIEGYGITLEKPELYYYLDEQWGISNKDTFDWHFSTKVFTLLCKFDFSPNFNYQNTPLLRTMAPDADDKYVFESFPTSLTSAYSSDGGVKTVYVKCENLEGEMGPEQKMNLEFDPTPPNTKDAFANPINVIEGTTTILHVDTDDKTLCRYSDNSDGNGSTEYETMEYSFPGEEEKILELNHEEVFSINFLGAKKDYSLNVICKNGAGDLSELKEIKFSVDYTAVGNIQSLKPSGYIDELNVTLEVETTKNALCEYKLGDNYVPFSSGANTKLHTSSLAGLSEKEYIVPVSCKMGEHTAKNNIKFIVDLTPPKITKVNDGNYTCGSDKMGVMVYSDEKGNISSYYYEVYEQEGGLSSYLAVQNNSKPLLNSTVGPDLPIKIPTSSLNESKTYFVKVKALDLAGHWSNFKESDGFVVVAKNYSICESDNGAPDVQLFTNKTCTSTLTEMHCEDVVGCNEFEYGISATSSLCEPSLNYNGQKLKFDKTSYLCYYVKDNNENNYTSTEKIIFADEDGDGIADSCDECPDTGAGKIVDEMGCADDDPRPGEKDDSDGDGLPDYWEKFYDQIGCELNHMSIDSNDDGTDDNFEDYDNDGYTNYQEYTYQYDPCLADAPTKCISDTDCLVGETCVLGKCVAELKKCTFDEDCSINENCIAGSCIKKAKKCVSDEDCDLEEKCIDEVCISEKQSNVLAWILFILGLLMVLGGAGYLIYYYYYSPAAKALKKSGVSVGRKISAAAPKMKQGVVDSWKEKFAKLRKAREEKLKEKKRQQIFGTFSKESTEIPHVEKLLVKKGPHLPRLNELAQTYSEHKEEIKPGLRKEEKSVFSKLDKIAEQSKEKKIHEIVDKDEAKEIFSKLKDISKKRKKS